MHSIVPSPSPPSGGARLRVLMDRIGALLDRPIPPQLLLTPGTARHARLMTRFGILGGLFGLAYALFYLAIGHWWGAIIILVCTVGVMVSPLLMRWKNTVERAANFFSLILTLGFLSLSFVEGGVHGHAIAWLVSVPLCALILAGTRTAVKWVILSFLASGLLVGLDLAGINLPVTYDPRWNSLVTAAGYLGLILFMCLLGLIFEQGRATAAARMQQVLDQLAATNKRLIALDGEKSEFLGIAAHDLKNPLAVIMLNGEMLQKMPDKNTSLELGGAIISAAERMHSLITNLLDVHAIEEGRFASKLECLDLGSLVEASVNNNRPSASRKLIEIRLGLAERVLVRADNLATMQILDNLISNAVKYTPFDSVVQIHLLCEREHALVRVRDEGPGISEEDQKKLFQKYGRLSASPTGGESSTGLGLAIVKKLVDAMGGAIECQSLLGYGAIFTLRLPMWTGPRPGDLTNPAKPQEKSAALPEGIPAFSYRATPEKK
jgi:signal transduction histidine kinase